MTILTKALPLYVNLIFGVLFVFIFTGTWLITNDLAQLQGKLTKPSQDTQAKTYFARIRFRRIIALLGGVVLVGLYFLDKNMTGFVAIIFGLFWINSTMLVSEARQFIKEVEGKS